jgi:hypothetical protein
MIYRIEYQVLNKEGIVLYFIFPFILCSLYTFHIVQLVHIPLYYNFQKIAIFFFLKKKEREKEQEYK